MCPVAAPLRLSTADKKDAGPYRLPPSQAVPQQAVNAAAVEGAAAAIGALDIASSRPAAAAAAAPVAPVTPAPAPRPIATSPSQDGTYGLHAAALASQDHYGLPSTQPAAVAAQDHYGLPSTQPAVAAQDHYGLPAATSAAAHPQGTHYSTIGNGAALGQSAPAAAAAPGHYSGVQQPHPAANHYDIQASSVPRLASPVPPGAPARGPLAASSAAGRGSTQLQPRSTAPAAAAAPAPPCPQPCRHFACQVRLAVPLRFFPAQRWGRVRAGGEGTDACKLDLYGFPPSRGQRVGLGNLRPGRSRRVGGCIRVWHGRVNDASALDERCQRLRWRPSLGPAKRCRS